MGESILMRGEVRQVPTPLGKGETAFRVNKFGAAPVVDILTTWLLAGFCYHMQTGTEDAPVTLHATLDDTLAVMVADNNAGCMVPLRFEANVAGFTTATNIQAMLEADMAKKRFSSGGTEFKPRQLNGFATKAAGADEANGAFYTIEGGDIALLAKSAVPDSIELARRTMSEDAITDPGNGLLNPDRNVFLFGRDIPAFIPTPGSLAAQFGSATADATGYAVLQFAQFPGGFAY